MFFYQGSCYGRKWRPVDWQIYRYPFREEERPEGIFLRKIWRYYNNLLPMNLPFFHARCPALPHLPTLFSPPLGPRRRPPRPHPPYAQSQAQKIDAREHLMARISRMLRLKAAYREFS